MVETAVPWEDLGVPAGHPKSLGEPSVELMEGRGDPRGAPRRVTRDPREVPKGPRRVSRDPRVVPKDP